MMGGQGLEAQALPRCPGHLCLVHCDTASSSLPIWTPSQGWCSRRRRAGQRGPLAQEVLPRVVIHGIR